MSPFVAARRRLLRLVALFTLTVFVSLQVTEALHNLCKSHVETHCAICQIAHHVPAAGRNGIAFKPSRTFSRIAVEARRLHRVVFLPARRSRDPPLA